MASAAVVRPRMIGCAATCHGWAISQRTLGDVSLCCLNTVPAPCTIGVRYARRGCICVHRSMCYFGLVIVLGSMFDHLVPFVADAPGRVRRGLARAQDGRRRKRSPPCDRRLGRIGRRKRACCVLGADDTRRRDGFREPDGPPRRATLTVRVSHLYVACSPSVSSRVSAVDSRCQVEQLQKKQGG